MSASASSVSSSPSSSSFSCSSCLDTCARSLPLKIVSCIPIIGLATSFFATVYVAGALMQNKRALNALNSDDKPGPEIVRLARKSIECIEVMRDHSLASVIRQVVAVALTVLGILPGGALAIGAHLALGILWFAQNRFTTNRIEELSAAVIFLETRTDAQKI